MSRPCGNCGAFRYEKKCKGCGATFCKECRVDLAGSHYCPECEVQITKKGKPIWMVGVPGLG